MPLAGAGMSMKRRIAFAAIAAIIGAVIGVAICELVDAFLLAITVEAGVAIVRLQYATQVIIEVSSRCNLVCYQRLRLCQVHKGEEDNKWVAISLSAVPAQCAKIRVVTMHCCDRCSLLEFGVSFEP